MGSHIPYITYREVYEGELQYYILQKKFPHFVCMVAERPIVNFMQPAPITAYNLWIIFQGTIRGQIPIYADVYEEIVSTMNDMALWFYENRILRNEKKYKKWKVLGQQPTT